MSTVKGLFIKLILTVAHIIPFSVGPSSSLAGEWALSVTLEGLSKGLGVWGFKGLRV